MVSFLDLPRELRDDIYTYCLIHRDVPPQDISQQSQDQRVELGDLNYSSLFGGNGIVWPKHMPSTAVASLLLVNKQIREETIYVLQKIDLTPELDILLVEENDIWPTWTYAPPMRKHDIRSININIRIAGIPKTGAGFDEDKGFTTIWHFCAILERLLRIGWQPSAGPDDTRKLKIHTLNLNFVTPETSKDQPLMAPDIMPHHADIIRKEAEESANSLLHPRSLADFLRNWMDAVLMHSSDGANFATDKEHDIASIIKRTNVIKWHVDGQKFGSTAIKPTTSDDPIITANGSSVDE